MFKIERPTDDDYKLAKEVASWMETLVDSSATDSNDYLYNLSILAKAGVVPLKGAGLAASAISAFQREQARKVQTAELANSKHMGAEKERMTLHVRLLNQFTTEWGFAYKFLSDEGNVVTVFSSALFHFEGEKKGMPIKVGEECWLKGTVKKHSEFRGVKETVLNRPDIVLSPEAQKANADTVKAAKRAKKAAEKTAAQAAAKLAIVTPKE